MLEQVLPSGYKVIAAPAASHADIEPLPGRRTPVTAARRDLWAIGRGQRLCSVTDRITPHRIASHRIASHRIASHRIASHRIASPRRVPRLQIIRSRGAVFRRENDPFSDKQRARTAFQPQVGWYPVAILTATLAIAGTTRQIERTCVTSNVNLWFHVLRPEELRCRYSL
ncbi:hypothetical protein N7541_000041 [Penicillium brevicompactum]|uniref:Uncharacterized protein n=1 Tax=Penicillium brevicompactum TaxID=5074 RepID=A0A9W9V4E4_PENBR|nr:hypothetical protein N7541_000041 [Penicillium brevicompactum]